MPGQDDRGEVRLRPDQAHPARMYDYYLGGKDNFGVDREFAAQVAKVFPSAGPAARINREFMHRATRWMVTEAGIDQFLDIGTGIPTEPNLHQVAQRLAPEAHVVYVDNDPLVLTHARALMQGTAQGRTAYVQADVNDPASILSAPQLLETLDLSRPVGLSMIALIHFVTDEQDPHGIITTLMNALAPGSFLALTTATPDFAPDTFERITTIYREAGIRVQFRSRDEFASFFTGLELVEPGVVVPHRWRPPETDFPGSIDADVSVFAGLARK
ncbi:SAM-dependent methyltransferase [Nocardia sp. NBC_01499]|uniref:SAM-dependent methyltransferase n=1 Tax=Nocardia sp. NBC_01499 TaxID=2903597 RepID=UPI00386DAE43